MTPTIPEMPVRVCFHTVGVIVIPCLLIILPLHLLSGDSGGPLLSSDNVLVGLVSWGEVRANRGGGFINSFSPAWVRSVLLQGCAQWNAPGVYARVSAAREWIVQQKCEFSSVPPSRCLCTQESSDCVSIYFNITYDAYASETGWKLVRLSDGTVMVSSPVGSITSSSLETISYAILVPRGLYSLELVDSHKDGVRYY
jgi:secreted trypsin-like serine protease